MKKSSSFTADSLKILENGILGIQTGDKDSILKALDLIKDYKFNRDQSQNEVYLH